ncbi:exopolysaccharide production protein ExoZ [Bradyrhizobium sp. USDA 4448]
MSNISIQLTTGKQDKALGIQAARALAAVGIMYFHSWIALIRFPQGSALQIPIWTKYGYLAVDFFFAISGYVICIVATKPHFNPLHFLIKRVFRIYPLWLLTLSGFAAMALAWRTPMPTETIENFLVSATLLPTQSLPFYGPGWSLQHEMAFYFLVAIVVPLGGLPALVAVLVATTIAVHTLDLPWYAAQLAVRHVEFLAGIAAFLLGPRMARLGFWLPTAVGFSLIWWFANYVGLDFIAPGLFFLVVAFANFKRPARWTIRLGDASYSIYLIHMATFFVISAITSRVFLPWWCAEAVRFGSMGVIIGASIVCWRWFEQRVNRYGAQLASKLEARGRETATR